MTECSLLCFNRSIEFTKTYSFINRFHRRAVRFMLMDPSYVVHQMPVFLSSMEHTKDLLDLLFGCQNFHLKFRLPIFDFHKLKVGKFPKNTTGKSCMIFFHLSVNKRDIFFSVNNKMNRRKRAYNWNHHTDDFANGVGTDRSSCRARYQQSSVDVFAKFVAIDQVQSD